MLEILRQVDLSILYFFYGGLPDGLLSFFRGLSRLGDGGFIWLFLALLVFIYARGKKKRWTLILVVLGLLSSYLLTEHLIKDLVARPRPFVDLAGLRARVKASGFSFPSGHATSSFVAAGIFSHLFSRQLKLRRAYLGVFMVYGLAGLMALSRLVVGVHYPSDVLAGALLGSLLSFLWVRGLACWQERGLFK